MDNVVPIRKPPRSSSRSILLSLLVTVIFAAVYYYVALPALNPKSADLYRYILFLCVVYALGTLIFSGGRLRQEPRGVFRLCQKSLQGSAGHRHPLPARMPRRRAQLRRVLPRRQLRAAASAPDVQLFRRHRSDLF